MATGVPSLLTETEVTQDPNSFSGQEEMRPKERFVKRNPVCRLIHERS